VQRSVLITGCSSGIGHDAAHTLARRGWRVLATCRASADCARLDGEGLESFPLDYEDAGSVAAAAEEAQTRLGGAPDAVFHNGAYAIPAPIDDLPRAAMAAIFQANMVGWHDLTARLLPAMRRRGSGRVVFNSSVLGFVPAKYRAAYIATKFAVEGYADTLRLETRGTGVHVAILQPGPIATRFRANAIAQFERWIDWQASDRADFYRAELLDRLYAGSGGSAFELPAAAVTRRLVHALEAPRPRARYRITVPTRVMAAVLPFLPQAAVDRLADRA